MLKKISLVLGICVIVLGLIMIITAFTGPELPRALTYVFLALAIINGVLISINAKKKD